MEWIKIFSDGEQAKAKIHEHQPQLVIIGSKRICLLRHREKFFAFQDACSHNGESLSKGHVNYLGEIICPWHNYCFDPLSGKEASSRSADLKTYPVRIEDSGFYIGI